MFRIIPVVGPQEFFFLRVGNLLYINKIYLQEAGAKEQEMPKEIKPQQDKR